ncbi:hypothetical protein ACQKFW_21165, partial [Bacillus subtilis]
MKKIFIVGAIVAGFFVSSVGINSVSAEEIDPIGGFSMLNLSYDRNKKTNVNNSPKRRYLRTLIFCTWEFVQLISGRFFMAKP